MAKTAKFKESRRNTVVGAALVIGAGLGITVGLMVGGVAGIAIGIVFGAGLGILFGAVWDALHPAKRSENRPVPGAMQTGRSALAALPDGGEAEGGVVNTAIKLPALDFQISPSSRDVTEGDSMDVMPGR